MIIENGTRQSLEIAGVIEGTCGVVGSLISFVPNRRGKDPATARAGLLDGVPVLISASKDEVGPFWTARVEPLL